MVRFRKPEETVDAVQFTGNWQKLAKDLGWTLDALTDKWPKVDRDYDGTMYSPPRHGHPLQPMPLNDGDWIVVRDGEIVSFATDGWFNEWERV